MADMHKTRGNKVQEILVVISPVGTARGGGSSDESGVRRSRGFSLCIYATVAATYTLIVPTAGSVYCVQ